MLFVVFVMNIIEFFCCFFFFEVFNFWMEKEFGSKGFWYCICMMLFDEVWVDDVVLMFIVVFVVEILVVVVMVVIVVNFFEFGL